PLHPLGHLVRDENLTKFRPRTAPTHGPAYVIMASRGRPTPATSAVDVVTKVKAYRLYGRYADVEVVIRPSADPRYRVVMIHLAHVSVRPGERVIAGLTRLGVARVFPFTSETDYYVGGHRPHVHLEVVDPRRPR